MRKIAFLFYCLPVLFFASSCDDKKDAAFAAARPGETAANGESADDENTPALEPAEYVAWMQDPDNGFKNDVFLLQ